MKAFSSLQQDTLNQVKVLLTDIDDTLTTSGKLTSRAYNALENLKEAGLIVMPVTGRSAGWCDHIARMWPVDAVVGENGAFYFKYDHAKKTMYKYFSQKKTQRINNVEKLNDLRVCIGSAVPGSNAASDQDYRITDLAIDVAEDVTRFSDKKINKTVTLAQNSGANAKISSIHVNCWHGNYSKLSTSLLALSECFGIDEANTQNEVLFIGDSPNDSTMFRYFDLSIGVANIQNTIDHLSDLPTYITENCSGDGFVEVANQLLGAHGFSEAQSTFIENTHAAQL